MGADLSNIIKTQKLTDEHVQFLVYQLLRGLKVLCLPYLLLLCMRMQLCNVHVSHCGNLVPDFVDT